MRAYWQRFVTFAREKDVPAKLISLLLAVILWAFIENLKVEKQRYRLPVNVKNLPAELAVAAMNPRYASVEIEGKRDEINAANVKGLVAVVDLSKAVEGENQVYDIRLERQQFPRDISVSLVERSVTVTVERKESRWVRVVPVISGSLPEGKMVIDKSVVPERVRITGPRSFVNGIDSVETEEISIYQESGEIQRIVGIKKGLPREVTVNEKIFFVKLMVVDRKNIAGLVVPIGVVNVPEGFEVEPHERQAEVYVRIRHNRAVTVEDVDVFVDAGRINFFRLFETGTTDMVQRELPVTVAGKNVLPADIVSYIPKKTLIRITKK